MLVSSSLLRRFCSTAVLAFALAHLVVAGEVRRPFGPADFDGWRSISGQTLSRDGRWLAYSYMPLEGDGDLVLRELATGRELRLPVGALPPPPLTASEENPDRPAPRREVSLALTGDGRFAVATVFPAQADTLAAKRAKKKAEEMPKEGLLIVDLASGQSTRLAAIKNFQVPARGGSWLAYLKEAAPEKKEAEGKDAPKADKKKDKKYGSDLVLRDLATGAERTFANVLEYSFARDGGTLVYIVSSRNEAENGVFAVAPGNQTAPQALASGPGRYRKFAWDRLQTQAAFLTDRAEPEAKEPRFALWFWKRGEASAAELLSAVASGVPSGWSVSGDATPAFSFDGKKLYASTAPLPPPPDERLEGLLDEEKVTADLWRWNDDFIPTVQKVRAAKDRTRSFQGVFDLASRRFTQISDLSLPSVSFSDDGALAFGFDDRPYRRRLDYDGLFRDLYLVDASTGARTPLIKELGEKAGVRWSHNGRWLAYFHQRQWYSVDARTGVTRSLTATLPVAFHEEESDLIEEPGSYGTAGWTSDGDSLLLYDRYDVWQVFPDGRPARNLTAGAGRAAKIQFRVQVVAPNEPEDGRRGIDPSEPLILRAENEVTRATGFYRTAFASSAAPERLLWADKNYRYLGRAAQADVLLLSASRFDEYPDLATTSGSFSAPAKVTDGGAQLGRFSWGKAELFAYRNADGRELQAMLCKPADFDPAKKYPVIVYIYEKLSQTLHSFTNPVPATYLNTSYYVSNGYVVLMPDIVYEAGHPGQSALKCVLPAVDELVRRGFVDEKAIGISGHSWGGYQIAYMLTQTSRFRAAEAGAAVGNMTSAYSGIRWGSGRARQFQYEKAQSRIGKPLAEAPLLYVENSPVFQIDRVVTPVLLVHSDQDDAVPFEQGLELFLALRRHDKEAYLFNYNGEFHGLRRRIDQKDFSRRMIQFFDHFLKGAPAPAWMTEGIPYLDRESEKVRFRSTP